MNNLEGKKALVTGGARGLGLAVVSSLVARRAQVTVVGRDRDALDAVAKKLGVTTVRGDVADESVARSVLGDVRPDILVLNAGTSPPMAPIHEQTWEGFSQSWNVDTKAGFHWIQWALRLPLPKESRVLVVSSGAAVNGSPLSGGHAGAKRMLWLMAQYANGAAKDLGLGIHFQVVVPRQVMSATEHGQSAARAYAKKRGISLEQFFEGFGAPLPPEKFAEHIMAILTDPQYQSGVSFGLKGDVGITSLDT